MQDHGRGHQSHTYDISSIQPNPDAGTIEITSADQVESRIVSYVDATIDHPVTRQLFDGVVGSFAISAQGGNWESAETARRAAGYVQNLHAALVGAGVVDLSDPKLKVAQLRPAINQFNSSQKRTLNKLLARAIRTASNPNAQIVKNLLNTKHIADDHVGYEPHSEAELEAFEHAARTVVTAAATAQIELMNELGFATANNAWMTVDPANVIADARHRDASRRRPLADGPRPLPSAPRIDHIDWVLLNPDKCDIGHGHRRRQTQHDVAAIVHPPLDVLTSLLILDCIADNTGANLATLLQQHDDTVEITGDGHGVVAYAKARNHTEGIRQVKTDGWFTAGGIVKIAIALTRFDRHH